ncbi:MAG TPA: 2-oxoglutarate dehydrogenase E1 component, partial [Chlamydiales bacterium]|nr:2-oxoglutarate dehydrogenase E1 component [Chlamydiales bacterium]
MSKTVEECCEMWKKDLEGEKSLDFLGFAHFGNLKWIEEERERYLKDRLSVDPSWRYFFEGVEFGLKVGKTPPCSGGDFSLKIALLIDAYRRFGHLVADINPLETPPNWIEELELKRFGLSEEDLEKEVPAFGFFKGGTLRELIGSLRSLYCGKIGFEYMGTFSLEMEAWFQEQIEKGSAMQLSIEEKELLLEMLSRSEILESFLHTRYVGQTRFSLEGNETAIPILWEVIDRAAHFQVDEVWIGMAHRGRLNVLANILQKPYAELLSSFEDDLSLSLFESDDVKYHMGFSSEVETKSGKKVVVSMPPNPSHLESVDPVLLGVVRGRQKRKGVAKKQILPIMIHGDAALAGQGVVYETLQMCRLSGYEVGGSLHIVFNNQIGYTTLPKEGRSTRYCTDIAKTFGMPIFHVNAESPESALFAAKLAMEFREKFGSDLFIDLIGYRKYGHNEGDEPFFTQPKEYQKIRSKASIRKQYLDQLVQEGSVSKERAEKIEPEFRKKLHDALALVSKDLPLPELTLSPLEEEIVTKVSQDVLNQVRNTFCAVPASFHMHPKLQKWIEERKTKERIDWAWGEALSFGSLLLEKHSIRLSGQDVQRGTFSQRHLIWVDSESGAPYSPLSHIGEAQGTIELINSLLSEYAGMGFEYGYSCSDLETLPLWEAQYGDFDNGAQIIIDQYLASAEQKWGIKSPLTLLLPHAYEGAGPEHSSARLERFLQLAAKENFRICNLSTPAQYFHLLRGQALRKNKKPLILMTPKSLLRDPSCTSGFPELVEGRFQSVLADPMPIANPKKLLFCTGKVFYDLIAARKAGSKTRIARIEELYPFPEKEVQKQIAAAPDAAIFWVQEEPENMGAWRFLEKKIE